LQTGGTGRLVHGDRQIGSKEDGKLRWEGIGEAEYTFLGGFLFGCFKFGGLGSEDLELKICYGIALKTLREVWTANTDSLMQEGGTKILHKGSNHT
jgi:hypothetical protein